MTKTNDLREFIFTASCNNCFTILASKFNLLHLVIFFLPLNWQLFSDTFRWVLTTEHEECFMKSSCTPRISHLTLQQLYLHTSRFSCMNDLFHYLSFSSSFSRRALLFVLNRSVAGFSSPSFRWSTETINDQKKIWSTKINTKTYLRPYQASMMKLFCENSWRLY